MYTMHPAPHVARSGLLLVVLILSGCGLGRGSDAPTAVPATPTATPFDPAAFTLTLQPVASGFTRPVFVTHAGDGRGRLFVIEKAGIIRVVSNGRVLPEPFLNITPLVTSQGNEQGLLGL